VAKAASIVIQNNSALWFGMCVCGWRRTCEEYSGGLFYEYRLDFVLSVISVGLIFLKILIFLLN
jgi:hypothetical protein